MTVGVATPGVVLRASCRFASRGFSWLHFVFYVGLATSGVRALDVGTPALFFLPCCPAIRFWNDALASLCSASVGQRRVLSISELHIRYVRSTVGRSKTGVSTLLVGL